MKKRILIICSLLAAISFSSFAYMNWNAKNGEATSCKKEVTSCNSVENVIPRWENVSIYNLNGYNQRNEIDFIYNIDSRFIWNITKEQIKNAKSIIDIYPKEATEGIENYSDVQITIMQNGVEISEFGNDEILNEAQLKLLKTLDYSSNFYVRANYGATDYVTSQRGNHIIYYITVIPEKEATYSKGYNGVIDYLRQNSKSDISTVSSDKLKPGRVNFTVTKEGKIENVVLDASSGYIALDKKMVDLITNMPEKWQPATNEKGEKVAQDLVFFFGQQGC